MQVLRPDRLRISTDRTRCFASPQYAKVGGVWQRIADIVSVAHDSSTAAYRVSLGDSYIEFCPRLRKGTLDEARISPGRFGHILDMEASEVDDFIQYDVTTSGATATDAGWAFAGDFGGGGKPLTLGLFVGDWIRRFGASKVSKGASSVELDLRSWKSQRASLTVPQRNAAGMARLDLDPTITAETGDNSMSSAGPTWADARAGTGWAVSIWDQLRARAISSGYAEIYRGSLRFDTGGLDLGAVAVALRIRLADDNGPMGKVRADVVPNYGTLEVTDWSQTSLENCGTVDTAGMSINDVLTYAVPPENLNLFDGGHTAFWLREADHDAADTEPSGDVCNLYFHDAGDATYPPVLEVTYPSTGGGTARTLTGAGS